MKERFNALNFLFGRFLGHYYGRVFLGLTLLNIIICYLFFGITAFLIRQFLITSVIVFYYSYNDTLKIFQLESDLIEKKLIEEYSFLRYYGPAAFLFVISFWISSTIPVGDLGESLVLGMYLYWLLFGLFTFVKIWAIFSLKELHTYYNVSRSVKLHGFRSFSTLLKVGHGGKVAGKVFLGIIAFDVAGERVLAGDVCMRSTLERKIGVVFFGVDARRTHEMKQALWWLERHPTSINDPLMFTKDGKCLTPFGVDKISGDQGYKEFQAHYNPLKVDHTLKAPQFRNPLSGLFGWGKSK